MAAPCTDARGYEENFLSSAERRRKVFEQVSDRVVDRRFDAEDFFGVGGRYGEANAVAEEKFV